MQIFKLKELQIVVLVVAMVGTWACPFNLVILFTNMMKKRLQGRYVPTTTFARMNSSVLKNQGSPSSLPTYQLPTYLPMGYLPMHMFP
jgi:hypothetical protein